MNPAMATCAQCRADAIVGPHGGYCCGQCGHAQLPDGYEREAATWRSRRRAEKAARKAAGKA